MHLILPRLIFFTQKLDYKVPMIMHVDVCYYQLTLSKQQKNKTKMF